MKIYYPSALCDILNSGGNYMDLNFLDSSEAVILSDENVRNENLKKSGNLI